MEIVIVFVFVFVYMIISIFIPTYNAASCIEKTLRSVLEQTYSNLEVWIVDDCSTDNTREILQAQAERDSRVRLLFKEKNEGFVPYSWNRVFPLLNGEFTFYMSHDDQISPDCIERLVRTQEETGADIVIPDCVFTYEDGTQKSSFSSSSTFSYRRVSLSSKEAFAKMLNYDIPGFALWRTAMIREIGMPTEAFNSDEGMQRIWALKSNKVTIDGSAKFYYLLTEGSITRGLKPYHLTGLKTQKRLLKTAFCSGIWWRYPKETVRFAWQYLKSYRYLHKNL